MNKVLMMGRLTRDPEINYFPSHTAVASFGLATSHKFKGSDGQMKENTCFVDCVIFGARADAVAKYFKKGSQILIEGRFDLQQWTDKTSGQKRSKLQIIVENFEFCGSKPDGGNKPKNDDGGWEEGTPDAVGDDEIPF